MERSEEFLKTKELLLRDLQDIHESVKIHLGTNIFTPSQLSKEIETETEIGVSHIELVMKEFKKFKERNV